MHAPIILGHIHSLDLDGQHFNGRRTCKRNRQRKNEGKHTVQGQIVINIEHMRSPLLKTQGFRTKPTFFCALLSVR